jgi:membrane-bound lytic murein transglycosylase D
MQATGRSYGLVVDEYIDERRDPVKSTRAAVAYLSDLYARFDSWHLAVAAYNAGEGRIQRAMRDQDSNDFWEIANGYYLPTETKLYVPKLIAAIMIARDPEKYGFADIPYQDPLEYETVLVPRWTSLQAVSVACGAELEVVLELNRQLRRAVTPPTMAEYPVRVPPGAGELVAENLPRVRKTMTTQHREHRVAKGETLNSLSRRYSLDKKTLLRVNKLRSEKISPGQKIRIPHEIATYRLLSESELAQQQETSSMAASGPILHRVQKGETAGTIARRYDVSLQQLAAWNNLKNPGHIRLGQKLALYPDIPAVAPSSPTPAGQIAVLEPQQVKTKTQPATQEPRQDETTEQIAVLEPQQVKTKMQPTTPESRQDETTGQIAVLEPQQVKTKVRSNAPLRTARQDGPAFHLVQEGETLWSIARKYQLSTRNIKRLNQMATDTIQPGRRLIIRSGSDLDA